jgi:hypothetical protein
MWKMCHVNDGKKIYNEVIWQRGKTKQNETNCYNTKQNEI